MSLTTQQETAWLVEAIWPEDNRPPTPQWWHPEHGWMWDANKALRFAREIDATDYIKSQRCLKGRATEHIFHRLRDKAKTTKRLLARIPHARAMLGDGQAA
jgi:hypothetical protein